MNHNIYFTPGPSQLYHTYEAHFKQALRENIPSINHRTKQFIAVIKETTTNLRLLLNIPEDYDVFFVNSANEAWDRILQNLVVSSSHHFANGAFGKKFHNFALQHRLKSTITEVGFGEKITDWQVPSNAELIGVTKNETSNGFTISEEEIKSLRDQNPDKLIALDTVSAAGAIPIDFKMVDVAYFSVQKCFGMPAGLGVIIANQKCQEKALKKLENQSIGSYRSFVNLKKFSDTFQTPETPNMLAIYTLGKIAKDMLNIGVSKIHNEIIYKSVLLMNAIQKHPSLELLINEEQNRSKTTIVAKCESDNTKILKELADKGFILGGGYKEYKNTCIRIANFPAHSKESVELLCDLLLKVT